MKSKWYEYKPEARKLRSKGWSIKAIKRKLGVPLSTLSGWLKDVELNESQKAVLKKKWQKALIGARVKAVKWHNEQKKLRLERSEKEALESLSRIDFLEKSILDLALAILYLGEGSKKTLGTCIGNSDPKILKFFVAVLRSNYSIEVKSIKCELHLRADQNPDEIKEFWSEELGIPPEQFTTISIDQRTMGRATYPTYKGVCVLRCGNVAIQRKLVYLSRVFCERVIENARLAHLVERPIDVREATGSNPVLRTKIN